MRSIIRLYLTRFEKWTTYVNVLLLSFSSLIVTFLCFLNLTKMALKTEKSKFEWNYEYFNVKVKLKITKSRLFPVNVHFEIDLEAATSFWETMKCIDISSHKLRIDFLNTINMKVGINEAPVAVEIGFFLKNNVFS